MPTPIALMPGNPYSPKLTMEELVALCLLSLPDHTLRIDALQLAPPKGKVVVSYNPESMGYLMQYVEDTDEEAKP
jgi:hypothetical protein